MTLFWGRVECEVAVGSNVRSVPPEDPEGFRWISRWSIYVCGWPVELCFDVSGFRFFLGLSSVVLMPWLLLG